MTSTAPANRRELLPFQIVMTAFGASLGGIVAVLGDLRDSLGFTETQIGAVVAAGFAAAFISQVAFARFADRGHGQHMARAGVVIAVVALCMMAVVDGLAWWITARASLGLAIGLAMPVMRRAAAVIDREHVGENLGRMVIGEVGGYMIGPVIAAAFVETIGIRAPFVAFAIGMTMFGPFVWRLPADSGAVDRRRKTPLDLLRFRELQGALFVVTGYFTMIGAWEAVMPIMFFDRGGGALVVGLTWTLLAVPVLLLSPAAGRLADRVGPPRIAVLGTGITALGVMWFGLLPGLIWPVVWMLFLGVFDTYGVTATRVTVSRSVPEERQAAALGLMGAVEVLSAGASALPTAVLYDHFGAAWTWAASGLFGFVVVMLGAFRFRGSFSGHVAATR